MKSISPAWSKVIIVACANSAIGANRSKASAFQCVYNSHTLPAQRQRGESIKQRNYHIRMKDGGISPSSILHTLARFSRFQPLEAPSILIMGSVRTHSASRIILIKCPIDFSLQAIEVCVRCVRTRCERQRRRR